eukprot:scaffold15943_cov68-Phaeocystis_antarctica.AAC.11
MEAAALRRPGTPKRSCVPKVYRVPTWLGRLYRGPGMLGSTLLAAARPPAKTRAWWALVDVPKPKLAAEGRVDSG